MPYGNKFKANVKGGGYKQPHVGKTTGKPSGHPMAKPKQGVAPTPYGKVKPPQASGY